VQTRLDQRMIEGAVLFATGHKREACQIREHRSGPILAVKPEECALRWELIRCEIARDRSQSLAQFLPVMAVATVPETAEPLVRVGLRNRCARPDHFPALASPVAGSTHVIQSAKGRGQVFRLR
jgi:hypothetical protein